MKRFVLISCFILLIVTFSEATSKSFLLDRVVAVIDKEVITWSELYRTMEFELGMDLRNVKESDKKQFFKENEARYLEILIDRKLQLQEAKRLGITASNEEIKEAIEGIKKKYKLSDKEFTESIKAEGMTIDEYRSKLAEQIVLGKVVNLQVRSKIIVSEEEINDYLSKSSSPLYRIRLIMFKSAKDRDKDSMMAKAELAIARIKAGEDFSAVAYALSEDPSAKSGGNLGFIKKEMLSKEFVEIIKGLKEGDISEPFWTDKGLYIIKLDERVEPKTREEMREIAKKKVFEKKFNEAYKSWLRSLREKAFIEVRL